jgi:SF3a60/Prp9 C-terminal
LHGLGIEYKCEICGNYSYWGRRAFERHFQEWRHAYGMKCLRIPNTIHFKEITSINDALACKKNKIIDNLNFLKKKCIKNYCSNQKYLALNQKWKKNMRIVTEIF